MAIIFCFLAKEARCNIILKTLVVNPSKTKAQTAVLKAYLPKEATAEDVVDLGDLKISYDIEKELYFVYQEYELEPGASVTREIEIKDVWVISKAEIDSLLDQVGKLVERLKETPYFDMAVKLQKDIEDTASDILERQEKSVTDMPQAHIGAYRKNMKIMGSVSNDLARLEQLALETGTSSGSNNSGIEKINVKATWKLIVAMIVVLGVLSFVFFIIWSRQAAIESTKQKIESEEKKTSL